MIAVLFVGSSEIDGHTFILVWVDVNIGIGKDDSSLAIKKRIEATFHMEDRGRSLLLGLRIISIRSQSVSKAMLQSCEHRHAP